MPSLDLSTLSLEELTNLLAQANAQIVLFDAQVASNKAAAAVQADRITKQKANSRTVVTKIQEAIDVLANPAPASEEEVAQQNT